MLGGKAGRAGNTIPNPSAVLAKIQLEANGLLTTRYCASLRPNRRSPIANRKFQLRARARITSHFGIPSSGQLRPPLNREILNVCNRLA